MQVETLSSPESPNNDLVFAAHKRFCRILLLRTVKEACELRRWYETGEYSWHYYFQFGFNKRAPREKAFKRVAGRMREWILSEFFVTCCKASKIDADNARSIIHQVLMGNQEYERVTPFLEELQEETEHYATARGVKPQEAA